MHIGIIVNPKSGRNKAAHLASQCESILKSRGHQAMVFRTDQQPHAETDDFFNELERLIIVGGDGTVHYALPQIIAHQAPFVHLATGTSNLIATELGMPRSPIAVIDWIEHGGSTLFDVPTIEGIPFLIMCSLGMDAGVIHRFETSRKQSGGFRNYVLPVITEFFKPRAASVSIMADEQPVHVRSPMNVTIANMRSYALKINPCNNADPTDGKLDLLALPCRSTLLWSLHTNLSRLRIPIPRASRVTASTLIITATDHPAIIQSDGEVAITPITPGGILQPGQSITIRVGQFHIPIITSP